MIAKGFTLMEVLVAALIILPMAVLIVQLVPRMMTLNTQSRSVIRATLLCDYQKNSIWTACRSSSVGLGFSHDYTLGGTTAVAPFSDLMVQVTDDTQGALKTITVTAWKESMGNTVKEASEPGASLTFSVYRGE